jgi:hypothetical protein
LNEETYRNIGVKSISENSGNHVENTKKQDGENEIMYIVSSPCLVEIGDLVYVLIGVYK